MEHDNRLKNLVADIDKILESQIGDTKTETLAKQRGYLTGWLARLATVDWIIHQEIEAKLDKLSKK